MKGMDFPPVYPGEILLEGFWLSVHGEIMTIFTKYLHLHPNS